MGTPYQLYNSDPTQELESRAAPSSLALGSALSAQNAPSSSPASPGAAPGSNTTAIPQKPQGGPVKGYLMKFLEGFGDNILRSYGMPTPFEQHNQEIINQGRIAQANSENAEAGLKQAQTERMKGAIPVQTAAGIMYLPPDLATKILTAREGATAKTQASINTLRGALNKNGYDVDLDESGAVKGVKPMENMSPLQQAQIDRQNAEAALASANEDVKMNPDNPTFKQNQQKIAAQLAALNFHISNTLRTQDRNDMKADPDYKFASSVGTQNTLKYLGSLTGSNGNPGNLDTLIGLSDKIQRTDLPALNNAEAWARLQSGDPQIASYKAAVTEVADQVGKILQGGGTGAGTSDAKLHQAMDMFNIGFNPAQMKAVASTLRDLLANRKRELIGDNPYLNKYSDNPTVRPASPNAPNASPAPGGDFFGKFNGKKR